MQSVAKSDGDVKTPSGETPKLETSQDVIIGPMYVDNAGRGNCAYYAFANGLIRIIQQEALYKKTEMLDRLIAKSPSLATHRNALVNYDFSSPNQPLLDDLQASLRIIAYEHQLTELREACHLPMDQELYIRIRNNHFYTQFEGMYSGTANSQYDQIPKSPAVVAAIEQLKQSTPLETGFEYLALVPLFLKLIYGQDVDINGITRDTYPSQSSPIIESMATITRDFEWGTRIELDDLARAFDVNLHILREGSASQQFNDMEGKHTITLNNIHDQHWTTVVIVASDDGLTQKAPQTASDKKEPAASPIRQSADSETSEKREPIEIYKPDAEKKEVTELASLKQKVEKAVNDYINHSNSIWFCFFHFHGETGRKRASQFLQNFNRQTDVREAKEMIIQYLENEKNGNTHPHSFRTMLLHELRDPLTLSKQPRTLKSVSDNYEGVVMGLRTQYSVTKELTKGV